MIDQGSQPRIQDDLQTALRAQPEDSVLVLPPGEYEGPIVLDRPLTIHGERATIWARVGPVVRISSPGVSLRDLRIELTGDDPDGDARSRCALEVTSAGEVKLSDIRVRGLVIGLEGEDGDWDYPSSLRVDVPDEGRLARRVVRIRVPVPCRISSSLPALHVFPQDLAPGINEVYLSVKSARPERWANGELRLITPRTTRVMSVTVSPEEAESPAGAKTPGQILWGEHLSGSEAEMQPRDASHPRLSALPRVRPLVAFLAALALLAVVAQGWALLSLVRFEEERNRLNIERETWKSTVGDRADRLRGLEESIKAGQQAVKGIEAAKSFADGEVARSNVEIAAVTEKLALSRKAQAALDDRVAEATSQLRESTQQKREFEEAIKGLTTRREALGSEVEALDQRRARSTPDVEAGEAALQRVLTQTKASAARLAELETKQAATQTSLGETRQAILRATTELEGMLGEKTKAIQGRDAARADESAAKKAAELARADLEATRKDIDSARTLLQGLSNQVKAAREALQRAQAESSRAEEEHASLQRAVVAREAELKGLREQIKKDEGRRQVLGAEIEKARSTLDSLKEKPQRAQAELGKVQADSRRRNEATGGATAGPPSEPTTTRLPRPRGIDPGDLSPGVPSPQPSGTHNLGVQR
jgi:hypothetical protein